MRNDYIIFSKKVWQFADNKEIKSVESHDHVSVKKKKSPVGPTSV